MRSRKDVKENSQGLSKSGAKRIRLHLHFSLCNYLVGVTDVGFDISMSQRFRGRHYLLSLSERMSTVGYGKGDKKGSIEVPFHSICRIQPALLMTAI